jgi:hypothetical protein
MDPGDRVVMGCLVLFMLLGLLVFLSIFVIAWGLSQ